MASAAGARLTSGRAAHTPGLLLARCAFLAHADESASRWTGARTRASVVLGTRACLHARHKAPTPRRARLGARPEVVCVLGIWRRLGTANSEAEHRLLSARFGPEVGPSDLRSPAMRSARSLPGGSWPAHRRRLGFGGDAASPGVHIFVGRRFGCRGRGVGGADGALRASQARTVRRASGSPPRANSMARRCRATRPWCGPWPSARTGRRWRLGARTPIRCVQGACSPGDGEGAEHLGPKSEGGVARGGLAEIRFGTRSTWAPATLFRAEGGGAGPPPSHLAKVPLSAMVFEDRALRGRLSGPGFSGDLLGLGLVLCRPPCSTSRGFLLESGPSTHPEDTTVRLWSVDSGRPRGGVLEGHAATVITVAFAPDGKLCAWMVWGGPALGESRRKRPGRVVSKGPRQEASASLSLTPPPSRPHLRSRA